jgi:DNA repair protein RecN (Recombination protein N)
MLLRLSVQNYALIDKLDVEFTQGLTVITGETGAGKSILLGALGLVSGSRADSQSLYDKQKKCAIEATFDIKKYNLKSFFSEHDLDYEHTLVIRREINSEGKSRAFINDTPVTLTQLKELSDKLIDIHSQHQTLTFHESNFQLAVVDAYAKHQALLDEYAGSYKQFKTVEKLLNELIEKDNQAKKDADYYRFQFDELEEINLVSDEQEALEKELQALNNAEGIKLNLLKASQALNGGELNVLSTIGEIKVLLGGISKFKSEINELYERLNSSYIELKDIYNEIENIEQDIVYDPNQIEKISGRLDIIYRLQQKHQVKTVAELIAIKEELSNKLLEYDSLEAEIEKASKEKNKLHALLHSTAGKISENRKKIIPTIEKNIEELLALLSMPNATLKVVCESSDTLTANGMDAVKFLFSANKGSEPKELHKVASGGELSRLMLSIKSLIAQLTLLPTIIFDEIDTGVSGDVADKMGILMQKIAKNIQVISITHLPQIAAKGDTHLYVFKEEKNNRTYSNIKQLNEKQRIDEIAKMLSTGIPTIAAIKNAEDLLKNK